MTKHLERDLDALKREILTMGSRVEEAANHATLALIDGRIDLAAAVIEGDNTVDALEMAVEDECLKLLALHQPVAADLRYVVAVLKVNNDLERIGDLAANIARRALDLSHMQPIGIPPRFPAIVERVKSMIRRSLDSLVNRDTALAWLVCEDDDFVDDGIRETYVHLQDLMRGSPEAIVPATHLISAARYLERMADLATNVAEDVVFLVEGQIIRHQRSRADGTAE